MIYIVQYKWTVHDPDQISDDFLPKERVFWCRCEKNFKLEENGCKFILSRPGIGLGTKLTKTRFFGLFLGSGAGC